MCILLLLAIITKSIALLLTSSFVLTDLITYLLYSSGIISLIVFREVKDPESFLKFIGWSFYPVFIMFFIQYFYHSSLPTALTEIPNLFSEIGIEKYTRELEDIFIYRPNALIGNPITLGYFLNFILVIELYFYNNYKNKFSLVKIAFIILMIFLLFSRANIFLSIGLLSFNFILTKNSFKRFFLVLSLGIFSLLSIGFIYSLSPYIGYLIDRFTGTDSYAASSVNEHLHDYQMAYTIFLENPILGIQPSWRIENSVITDGAFLSLLLDLGLIGFIPFLVVIGILTHKTFLASRTNKVITPFVIFLAFFLPYIFLNSALLNKGVFLIIFIFFGLISSFVAQFCFKKNERK
jgi:hypothetical protein